MESSTLSKTQENDSSEEKVFPRIIAEKFKALGTEIFLQFVIENDVELNGTEKLFKLVSGLYEKYTLVFSRFDSKSELSKLNSDLGNFHEVSAEMLEIAKLSVDFHQKTQHFFDPRILDDLEIIGYSQDFKKGIAAAHEVESQGEIFSNDLEKDLVINGGEICFSKRMDFSGIAKGFITDKIAQFLIAKGRKDFVIDSGGDIYISGRDDEGNYWPVDVEGIVYQKLMFSLSDIAIATSGIGARKWEVDGKRFHHIINPKNSGEFLFDLKSVSVIAKTTTEADVWAKTLFLMGKSDGIKYAKENSLSAVFLDYRGGAWISPKAKEFLHHD